VGHAAYAALGATLGWAGAWSRPRRMTGAGSPKVARTFVRIVSHTLDAWTTSSRAGRSAARSSASCSAAIVFATAVGGNGSCAGLPALRDISVRHTLMACRSPTSYATGCHAVLDTAATRCALPITSAITSVSLAAVYDEPIPN
jgi:hypothetical protein